MTRDLSCKHSWSLATAVMVAFVSVSSAALANNQDQVERADDGYNLDDNTAPHLDRGIDLKSLPSDMDMLFPLSPEEKLEIRERQLRDQEATYRPLRNVEPKRELVRVSANADRIPEVMVTPDYPTSIVFTDITGAPWPINYIGQTNSLATIEQPTGTENSLVIYANNSAGRKSVSVFLEGLTLPVTMTITGDPDEYHALKHIRINERGPNAPSQEMLMASVSSSAPSLSPVGDSDEAGTDLDMILNKLAYKVTPEGFRKLTASDPSVDAWIEEENPQYLYVMTDYRLVSPAPRAGARSVTPLHDNVRIYIIPRINPVMALNSEGSRVYLTFKE